MPFRSGAAFVFDWADASDHRSIELNGDRTEWIVVDVTDSVATTLATFPNETAGDDTLVIRRLQERIDIDFPDTSSRSLPIASDPSRTTIGAKFKLGIVPIAQFDIGDLEPTIDNQIGAAQSGDVRAQPQTKLTIPPGLKELNARTDREDVPAAPITLGPTTYSLRRLASRNGLADAIAFIPTKVPDHSAPLVVVLPGFHAMWSAVSWLGPQLASRGIAVAIGVPPDLDALPQLRSITAAALTQSALVDPQLGLVVDPENVHVAGHSMGASAGLHRAAKGDSVRTAIALSPWDNNLPEIGSEIPTLIISCENDSIAKYSEHVKPLLDRLDGGPAYSWIEVAAGEHDCTTNRTVDPDQRNFMAAAISEWVRAGSTVSSAAAMPCEPITGSAIVSRSWADC